MLLDMGNLLTVSMGLLSFLLFSPSLSSHPVAKSYMPQKRNKIENALSKKKKKTCTQTVDLLTSLVHITCFQNLEGQSLEHEVLLTDGNIL